jgi:hypothetical protein
MGKPKSLKNFVSLSSGLLFGLMFVVMIDFSLSLFHYNMFYLTTRVESQELETDKVGAKD